MTKYILAAVFVVASFAFLKQINQLTVRNVIFLLIAEIILIGTLLTLSSASKHAKTTTETGVLALSDIQFTQDSADTLTSRFFAQNNSDKDTAEITFALTIQDCSEEKEERTEEEQKECAVIDTLKRKVKAHIKQGKQEFFTVRFKRDHYQNVSYDERKQFNKSNQYTLSVSNYTYY